MIFGSLNNASIRRGEYVYIDLLTLESNRSHSKSSEFLTFSLISGRHVDVSRTGTNQHGASILSSINLWATFRQITQERCTAQT